MSKEKKGRQAVGHPIDVASGVVFTTRNDFSYGGAVPLIWDRRYGTDTLEETPSYLGQGWSSSFQITLTRDLDGFSFHDRNGVTHTFDIDDDSFDHRETFRLVQPESRLELCRVNGFYQVLGYGPEDKPRLYYLFVPEDDNDEAVMPLACISNPSGWRLECHYDREGFPNRFVQGREKRTFRFVYTHAGGERRLAAVTTSYGGNEVSVARYEYDAAGRLVAAYDPTNCADRYAYNDAGLMIEDTPRGMGTFTFEYDEQQRCIYSVGADNYQKTRLEYADHARTTRVTNSHDQVTTFQYNDRGQVETRTAPSGAQHSWCFDEAGRLVAQIDPEGGQMTLGYDTLGRLTQVTDPLGGCYQVTYNTFHLPTQMTDAEGRVWTREYDQRGYLAASTDPNGARWTYTHDASGDLVKVVNAMGSVQKFQYDERGNNVAHSDWLGNWAKFQYDELQNMIAFTDPSGRTTRHAYDFEGRLLQTTRPDGMCERYDWDYAGRLKSVTNGRNHQVRFDYGVNGHLLAVTNASGNSRRFQWDSEPNRLLAVTNEMGETQSYLFDSDGWCVRETRFNGSVLAMERDKAGMCRAIINGEDERIELHRDAGGRLVQKVLPDGNKVEFEWSPSHHLTRAANAHTDVRWERDCFGQVLREHQGDHFVENQFNPLSDRISRKTSLGDWVKFGYDANSQITEVNLAGAAMHLYRDPLGREIERRLPGGGLLSTHYGDHGLVAGQKLLTPQPGQAPSMHRAFEYDPAGNPIRTQDARWGEVRREFDAENQPLIIHRNGQRVEQYQYDAGGNKQWVHQNRTRHYGPGGRIEADGNTRFHYDRAGRLCRREQIDAHGTPQTWTYHWDGQDRLIRIDAPDGRSHHYAYDPLGRRISKEGPAGKTRYVWDTTTVAHVIEERDGAEEVTSFLREEHTFSPLAVTHQGRRAYAVNEPIGLTREWVDGGGQVQWAGHFDTWGGLLQHEGSPDAEVQPARYQGQWLDEESGFAYNWFRYYMPDQGLYASEDPLGLNGNNHLYQYAHNPLTWMDPYGLAGGGPYNIDSNGVMTDPNTGNVVPLSSEKCSAILTTPQGHRSAFVSGWGDGVSNWSAGHATTHQSVRQHTRSGPMGNWCHAEMRALSYVMHNPGQFRGTTVTLQIRFPPCHQGGTGCEVSLTHLRQVLADNDIRLRVVPRNVHTACP
ncbi:RHS repeat-associated core domain-containing protein [Acanthopleuribacter pedis]|uniref:RHS repeat protein n=1 Tax=Acanthopleuribacter pedis TaxID=442870 RepID=A0A8J7QB73_9BACT|nr:RHS repeat-associated core domain-containing protein [Acanthopleuribacter pedis]MBO1320464.1 RHS repeat protein [Acanthopleuribacter pedis]